MGNLASIARPYALAAFEYAKAHKELPEWKVFLESAAYIAKQTAVIKILANPELSSIKLFALFDDTLKSLINPARKNFLHLLSQNKRLNVLADISELFNAYYQALEKISKVRVVTAVKAPIQFEQKLTEALSNRIQHDITLESDVDPAIIGGAIIHIGDSKVIDASIRGKLSRLLETLTS